MLGFSSRKTDLIITILVAWLSNVSVLAQVTTVATQAASLHPTPSAVSPLPSASDQQQQQNDSHQGPQLRKLLVTDYSILSSTTSQQSLASSSSPQQDLTQPNSTLPTTTEIATTTTTSRPPPVTQQASNRQAPQPTAASLPQQPYCTLGDDTYQMGERWNPNLPPFGVQVCVLCECTIRQRKSCYETKVTCRRITNECPVIDSCPDGKKPVTVAGQCCKSCQSAASAPQSQQQDQQQSIGDQSPAYDSQPMMRTLDQQQQPQPTPTTTATSLRIVYMNERTKEYMSLVENLPACPSRDGEPNTTRTPQAPVTPANLAAPTSKAAKGSRNDLNGIDTRLAFKTLEGTASASSINPRSRQPSDSSTSSSQAQQKSRFDQTSSDDHQHPNDVQSGGATSNSNHVHQSHPTSSYNSESSASSSMSANSRATTPNSCKLGNDTFQVGDVWNPILPPLGVQVCVQCNCIFRIRKSCYETKVTCRRINRDCPVIDVCPDGKPPINVDGRCCKTCPNSSSLDGIEQEPAGGNDSFAISTTSTQSTTLPLDGIKRNEKIFREFQALSRSLSICVKSRESVDIYNTNRYARRSRLV